MLVHRIAPNRRPNERENSGPRIGISEVRQFGEPNRPREVSKLPIPRRFPGERIPCLRVRLFPQRFVVDRQGRNVQRLTCCHCQSA